MSDDEGERQRRNTVGIPMFIPGNALFDRAAYAIGLDGMVSRQLLADALKLIDVAPGDVTPDQLGALLTLIDHRIRLVTTPDIADRAAARLRSLLFNLEGLET